jgi:nitrite reductase/ring-hydroxylating ferredoxin subunit
MQSADRAPKERYYDPEFYRLEGERLWSRTWQMACRLEEIPDAYDFAEYEILDQSVVVVRTEGGGAQAFQNACRHRGVKVAVGRGACPSGFTCPFHGWCYAPDGKNTAVTQRRTFSEHNLQPGDIDLVPVRCETWGGCAWINLDADAPPLRSCLEPFASVMDAWQLESMRAEWWYACRLPVNWKIAEEAFMEQYHVLQSHPQLRIPGRMFPRPGKPFDRDAWLDGELQYLHTMSDGMAGMVHAKDVAVAEGLRGIDLPMEPKEAAATWQRTLNDAVVGRHRSAGAQIPDLNDLAAQGLGDSLYYGFPHFFVLPMYSSASSYRFRPLGPEETLMEIWSLTRYPAGSEPATPPQPEVWEHDDPRWPPIPAQDFSNLPKQQKGLHAKGFEYLRLSEMAEGGISNFERLVDGFLAGLSHESLQKGLAAVNVNPLEQPVADLGF